MLIAKQTKISNFVNFNCTSEETDFSNDCTQSTKNPTFFYKHRRGISTDIFNPWRRLEEPVNYSRADIARSYRLGGGF